MKFIFLFILLLSSYHIHAQKTKVEAKGITTKNVVPKPVQKNSLPTTFSFAEQMPMFRDTTCLNLPNRNEQKACADQKLLQFIYTHISCPNSIKEMGIEVTVIVSFIVDSDGSLRDFKILRGNDPPAFAQEFIRVIKLTTEKNGPWVPATQRGKAIPLRMHLPCKLNLR
jgi:protein TonB